jgi:transcriptional regulator with XRE-family HTH domain
MLSKRWGERLRDARKSKFTTQEAFAAALTRDQSWVSRYERGDAPWTLEVMLTFAAVLGEQPGKLFEWPYGVELIEAHRLGVAA